jgi:DUF1009 family protein
LNPADVERVFREHAADLNGSAAAASTRILAFDGKVGGDNYLGRSATIMMAGRVAREHRL